MVHYRDAGRKANQYGAAAIPGTATVVNPLWRQPDKEVRTARQRLRKLQAKLETCAALEGGAAIQYNARSPLY